MAVFLVAGALVMNTTGGGLQEGTRREKGVFGGPIAVAQAEFPEGDMAALGSGSLTAGGMAGEPEDIRDFESEEARAGMLSGREKSIGILNAKAGPFIYKVVKGDTLSGIAANFGISVGTIIDANPSVRGRMLQIGQELTVLPVSGVSYVVREGETIESVASLFNLAPAQIREFNASVNFAGLEEGVTLVIPGARASFVARAPSLPDLSGYFVQPAQGFNWGKLHKENAVDIANSCGTEVVAAQEGLVIDASPSGWNSGYGHFVFIEHPNGTNTRYAHLAELTVSIGDYVKQGDKVGSVGNTGNVHGVTGCHLHFEVEGAENPFAK